MSATSRELVYQALNFERPARAPRNLWTLPWAEQRYKNEIAAILANFPGDMVGAPGYHAESPKTEGEPHAVGRYRDEWGCLFVNLHEGVIGEVKDPIIKDWGTDTRRVHVPREWLTIDRDQINRFCEARGEFVTGGCCPRPFEQLQFLRGTAELYTDLLAPTDAMQSFLREMHAFYCDLLEAWADTNVDGLTFMDDWGAQNSLLIDPAVWREIFKPMYRDYIQIAHAAGKKMFMHTDGHTLAIFPDLIELGLDAVNAQIFCIGVEKLAPFAGQITFWGEIDRQHLLPHGTQEDIDHAVRSIYETLWRNGGCIAQCEFGPAGKPENVRQVFVAWNALTNLEE